jgi:hypothetical protein
MKVKQWLMRFAVGVAFATAVGLGSLGGASPAQADDDGDGNRDEWRARIGLEVAPVPLNLAGKNQRLVGLGSYLVNVVSNCNDCHSAGPATQFAKGGNPYKGQPTVINPATYLGGGRVFPQQVLGATPIIISRNLTPDKTGRPEGGRTFEEFRFIIRTGTDLDHLHPNCSDPTITSSTTCYPRSLGFDGDLLQIMPWPGQRHLAEHDLRAIYEYLSAIPCIEGPPAPDPLHNDCS